MKTKGKKNDLPNQWLLITASVFIALILMSYATSRFNAEISESIQDATTRLPIPATHVMFDFGGGKQRVFKATIDHQVFQLTAALQSISETAKLALVIKQDQIIEVAEVKNRPPKQWRVYRNGKIQKTSIAKLAITGGDTYLLKYE